MKDGEFKCVCAMGGIVACYGIYAWSNPGTDGAIFASILAALSALATYTVVSVRMRKLKEQ